MRPLFGTALCIGILFLIGLNSPVSDEHINIVSQNEYLEHGPLAEIVPEGPCSFSIDEYVSLIDAYSDVSITLSKRGAALFESVSSQNIGRRLAIVMNDKVLMAPVIQDKISGGKLVISGNFAVKEAVDLSLNMRTGFLPPPFTILESRIIAPASGKGVGS